MYMLPQARSHGAESALFDAVEAELELLNGDSDEAEASRTR